MKRKKLVILFSLIVIVLSGCVSKHKLAEFTGAHIKASGPVKKKEVPVENKKLPEVVTVDTIAQPDTVNYALISVQVKPEELFKEQPTFVEEVEVSVEVNDKVPVEVVPVKKEAFVLEKGNVESMRMAYHVVVGSFSSHENAQKLHATLLQNGFTALVVINESNMYRVIIASFNDYEAARSLIFKYLDQYPDAWILMQQKPVK